MLYQTLLNLKGMIILMVYQVRLLNLVEKEAIDDKIGSIMENNTWALSDLPSEFRQKEGINYFDTYVPVARITTIRLLLTLAAIHNLVIHQMDVKTTFLNGDLDEYVYMKQPGVFIMSGNEHKIKRENKGIVITQSHYIKKILKKFNREDCSPVSTPIDPVEKLKPNTVKPVDQLEYSRAIGLYDMLADKSMFKIHLLQWLGVPSLGSSGKSITLFNVLYVPKLRKNLISGPVLNKCGYKQVYESDKYILSKSGVFVGFGYYNNGMFMLNLNKVPDDSGSVYMSSSTVVNSSLWHARLGHVHYKRMLEMSKDDLIPAIDENTEKCSTCMLTKITRQPFKSITRKSVILELIHSDLCDFHATPSLGNKKYVITFIDDASRFCYVYLLHAKDEALDKFRIYKTEVELQQNDLIKTLRTDRGGEYYDPVFFQSVGIIHETMAPYTPQQNGVAERKNRALKEMVNSMLSYSGLSEGFWGEVMAVVRLPDPQRKTLGEKGIYCILVGYAEQSKAYRFYVIEPNDPVSINTIIESKDAKSDENRFSSIPRPKDIIPNSNESQRDDHSNDVPSETLEHYKGKRARKAKSYYSNFQLYVAEGSRDQIRSQNSYCYSIEEDPRTYKEAMQSRDIAF
ncbi:zinc finger, CCHC-type containing protein [Tanacetum coccineum]